MKPEPFNLVTNSTCSHCGAVQADFECYICEFDADGNEMSLCSSCWDTYVGNEPDVSERQLTLWEQAL